MARWRTILSAVLIFDGFLLGVVIVLYRANGADSLGYFVAPANAVLQTCWPLTSLLALGWVWAFVTAEHVPDQSRWRTIVFGCLPPFAFPIAILVCGVIFVSERPWVSGVEAPSYPSDIIGCLVLAQLPLAGLSIWCWGKLWPAIATAWAVAGYLSLIAGFVSSMSVTGVWL